MAKVIATTDVVEILLKELRSVRDRVVAHGLPRDQRMQAVHEFRGAHRATTHLVSLFSTEDQQAELAQLWAEVHAVKVSLKGRK